MLQDWIEDTEYAIDALHFWLASLKSWQSQAAVSSEEFDRAYAVICDATLSEWAWVGLVELRMAVTGQSSPPDFAPLHYQLSPPIETT
jgi:hypothetical protein